MNTKRVPIACSASEQRYEILVGSGLVDGAGKWAAECLGTPGNIAVVSNPKVFGLYGDQVVKALHDNGFRTAVWLMKDGERYKNMRSLAELLEFLSANKISRSDAIVSLGGGVVGDLSG